MKAPDTGSWRKYINKAKAKKWLNGIRIALLVVLILAELDCFIWLRTLHIRYGVYDYSVIYEEQLATIFGDDYEISPGESVYGYWQSIVNGAEYYECYNTWSIKYKNSNGDVQYAWLSNAYSTDYSFEKRVDYWMWSLAEEHFENICLNPDYNEIMDNDNIRLRQPTLYVPDEWNIDEPEKWTRDVFEEYIYNNVIKSFKDLDKLPHFYEMSFEDWFVAYPSHISIFLDADEISDEILNDVLDRLGKETGGRFNLEIRSRDHVRYYIMGELREIDQFSCRSYDYDLELYQEYEKMGMFD